VRQSGLVRSIDDIGYRVGYAVAEDNLRVGRIVVADSVNPLPITRKAWLDVATRTQVTAIEIEILCTNRLEHRTRLETRMRATGGFSGPTWEEVLVRHYSVWEGEHLVIDTAGRTVEACVAMLEASLAEMGTPIEREADSTESHRG
jgi:predicted kinase